MGACVALPTPDAGSKRASTIGKVLAAAGFIQVCQMLPDLAVASHPKTAEKP